MLFGKAIHNTMVGVGMALAVGVAILSGLGPVANLSLMTLSAMVPIALPAIGELLNEHGGLFNIGIEGMMLVASLVAVYGAEVFRSGTAGLLVGSGVGALLALLFGTAITYGRANQTIAGLGLNFFGIGAVAFFMFDIWGVRGFRHVDAALRIQPLVTPFGPVRWISLATFIAPALAAFLLYRTRFGLHLRACGHNALVSDVSGINVHRVRLTACVLAGALAGLGGAYMSIDWLGMASVDLIAGRGFVALACVVFSGLNPWRALVAALVFAVFNATGLWLQVEPWAKPLMIRGGSSFFLMMPYAAVLALLAAAPSLERFPKEIGRPFRRG